MDHSSALPHNILEPFADMYGGDPVPAVCACPKDGVGGVLHADNCQAGGILWKFATVDILAAANGVLQTVQAIEGGAAGDFLRVQSIEGVIRIKYIIIFGTGAGAAASAGYGTIVKNRKPVQPTLDGSWQTDNVCGAAANLGFEDGIGKWVNPGNWQCIPPATNDSPIDISLVNTTVAPLLGICYGLGFKYKHVGGGSCR